ncbi:MAG: GAF domain-containing protein, partial [Psychroserpens sp.]
MSDINDNIESPFTLKLSFNKLLEHYDVLSKSDDQFLAAKASRVLKTAEQFPILRAGFSDTQVLKDREKEIKILLQDAFSPILTKNEIKTVSLPFNNLVFNSSERFKSIVKTAGEDFVLEIKNMPGDDIYIIACTIILSACYDYDVSFKRPFHYEIPDAKGIMQYYKILYN